MSLTKGQQAILLLADLMQEIPICGKAICPGIHFCPDWDFLPVCDDSPEKEACTCKEEGK